jgi:hypothetical protein
MDLVKKKKIKTLNEINTFNLNKSEIERQRRVLGLIEEDFLGRFQREISELEREHERRLKNIKRFSRIAWTCFIIGMVAQVVALILKMSK